MTGTKDLESRKNQEIYMKALKQDLRSAHFHLGNHQP